MNRLYINISISELIFFDLGGDTSYGVLYFYFLVIASLGMPEGSHRSCV